MAIEKRKSTSYEKAIVVAVNKENDQNLLDEELDELILLSDTAGAKVIDTIIQNRAKIDHPRTVTVRSQHIHLYTPWSTLSHSPPFSNIM